MRLYFTLRVAAEVSLSIYDVAGEPIWTVHVAAPAQKNQIVWEGVNDSGARCASGTYLLHLEAQGVDNTADQVWDRVAITR